MRAPAQSEAQELRDALSTSKLEAQELRGALSDVDKEVRELRDARAALELQVSELCGSLDQQQQQTVALLETQQAAHADNLRQMHELHQVGSRRVASRCESGRGMRQGTGVRCCFVYIPAQNDYQVGSAVVLFTSLPEMGNMWVRCCFVHIPASSEHKVGSAVVLFTHSCLK